MTAVARCQPSTVLDQLSRLSGISALREFGNARIVSRTLGFGIAFLLFAPTSRVLAADPPMSYLSGFGPVAVVPLTWGLLGISIAVVVIITVLVIAGVLKRRQATPPMRGERLPVDYAGHGLRWIFIGVGISSAALFAALIWALVTLAAINGPPTTPAVSLRITGYQWRWKVEYLNPDASRKIINANEIHIPVGEPVRVELVGGDVIHSFWIQAGRKDRHHPWSGKSDVAGGD